MKSEIRAFRISGKALDELIWELLNKYGETLLDLPENSETIFHMNWDKTTDELIFYALEFGTPRQVDFNAIDELVKDKVECNSDSLFTPGVAPYKTIYTTFNK